MEYVTMRASKPEEISLPTDKDISLAEASSRQLSAYIRSTTDPTIQLIKKGKSSLVAVLCIVSLCFVVFYNLYFEVNRDLAYQYTAMHRTVPAQNGGLQDSINFGNKFSATDKSTHIFTPMVEIAYYQKKKFLWDDRLFFLKDEGTILKYLQFYDFKYVVLPFYSGSTNIDNWVYYQGVPGDSKFYQLLEDARYFKIVESNNTFTAYERVAGISR